jgi:hypothetical protein
MYLFTRTKVQRLTCMPSAHRLRVLYMEGVFCFPSTKVQMLTYISSARSRLGVCVLVCGGLLLFRRGGGGECLAVGGWGGASTRKPTCNTHTLASATSWRRMAVDRCSFYLLLVQKYKICRLPYNSTLCVQLETQGG